MRSEVDNGVNESSMVDALTICGSKMLLIFSEELFPSLCLHGSCYLMIVLHSYIVKMIDILWDLDEI